MDFDQFLGWLISGGNRGQGGQPNQPAHQPQPQIPPPTMSGMPFQQPSHSMQGLLAPNQMLPTGGMMPYNNPSMQPTGIPYSPLQGTGMAGFTPSSNMGGYPQMYPYQDQFGQQQGYQDIFGNQMDRYRYGEQQNNILSQLFGY